MSTNLYWMNTDTVYSEICKKKKDDYSRQEIKIRVDEIKKLIWENRDKIWFDGLPTDKAMFLNPEIAARLIGFSCEEVSSLGAGYIHGSHVEVAGQIDNRQKKIQISTAYSVEIRNFTLAHELAHAVLHKENGLHRDRPLDGAKLSFNETEREADIFATEFLMSEKLLRERFKQIFLTEKFELNRNTAFALGFDDYGKFIKRFKETRQLSRILASTKKFNGRHIVSLSQQFKVSIEAMAIRLEELGLVSQK